jgi:hypothetical protein
MTVSITYLLSPPPKFVAADDNGIPYAGGALYTYGAGTSTPATTYSDAAGTANANPIILDSRGSATIYLDKLAYKFVLKDANANLIWTQDNIVDPRASISGNPVGDTDVQTLSNKTLDDTNTITVKDTLLTIENAAATTKTGGFDLSEVTAGNRRNLKWPDVSARIATDLMSRAFQFKKGTGTATASDLTIPSDGNLFTISVGTGTLTAIVTSGWQAGSVVILTFSGDVTVKYNTAGGAGTAKILLEGAMDFVFHSPDVLGLQYDGTVWQEIFRTIHSNSSTGLVRRNKTTIANAAIKTLPTAAVDLIAAPGVNRFIKILQVTLRGAFSGAAYTNVDPTATLYVRTKTGLRQLTKTADHSLFDTSADIYEVTLVPNDAGTADLYSKRDNEAVVLFLSNAAAGNLTAGDTNNTLAVFTTYLVESLND